MENKTLHEFNVLGWDFSISERGWHHGYDRLVYGRKGNRFIGMVFSLYQSIEDILRVAVPAIEDTLKRKPK